MTTNENSDDFITCHDANCTCLRLSSNQNISRGSHTVFHSPPEILSETLHILFKDFRYHHFKLQICTLSGASFVRISQLRSGAMLALLIGNEKVPRWGRVGRHTSRR
jgi:hypothetical protein